MEEDVIFDFIVENLEKLFAFMRNTVIFQPSLFDFPVTILDVFVGFFTANTLFWLFGFLDDYFEDFEV